MAQRLEVRRREQLLRGVWVWRSTVQRNARADKTFQRIVDRRRSRAKAASFGLWTMLAPSARRAEEGEEGGGKGVKEEDEKKESEKKEGGEGEEKEGGGKREIQDKLVVLLTDKEAQISTLQAQLKVTHSSSSSS